MGRLSTTHRKGQKLARSSGWRTGHSAVGPASGDDGETKPPRAEPRGGRPAGPASGSPGSGATRLRSSAPRRCAPRPRAATRTPRPPAGWWPRSTSRRDGRGRAAHGVPQAAHLSRPVQRSGRGQGRPRHLGGYLLRGPERPPRPRPDLSPRPGHDRLRPPARRRGARGLPDDHSTGQADHLGRRARRARQVFQDAGFEQVSRPTVRRWSRGSTSNNEATYVDRRADVITAAQFHDAVTIGRFRPTRNRHLAQSHTSSR